MASRYPAIPDETVRLSALHSYEILDTPSETEYDDIALLAGKCCGAPLALVSFTASDRQWFKAKTGTKVPEIPLSQSVCALAIGSGRDVFVVPDLAQDPDTRSNGLVAGPPYLRYYAGAILWSPQGHALGTVCVLDTVPRPNGLAPDEAASLQALARQTMILLELRRVTLHNHMFMCS